VTRAREQAEMFPLWAFRPALPFNSPDPMGHLIDGTHLSLRTVLRKAFVIEIWVG
jgi:hypothetical protein